MPKSGLTYGLHTNITDIAYNVCMNKSEKHTTIRLTPEAKRLLEELAKKLGVTKTGIIEMAIREFAEKREVK
jgi:uncharacterized protein (DUF1778 family)